MLTFKRFLSETATPANVDTSFTVGNVKFDNERGLGSTPDNANVAYKGAVAWMTPANFRKLAHHADRSEDARKLEALIRAGSTVGCPFLSLNIEQKNEEILAVRVTSHEGRARSDAIAKINGVNTLMPVHLFFHGGLRARDLTQEIWDHISTHGIRAEKTGAVVDPGIDHVFVSGKTIKL